VEGREGMAVRASAAAEVSRTEACTAAASG
jgi:hypothetical protein